jgi:glyoxylate reductase/D-3-phosphoglycerate dehydrogenase
MSDASIALMLQAPEKVRDVGRQLLPKGFQVIEVPQGATDLEAARIVAHTAYFLGFITKPMAAAFYDALAHTTRLVQLLSAGYDQVDLGRLRERRIPVATNGAANAVAVAEHTILLMLAVLRQLRTLDARTRAGSWRPQGTEGEIYELEGKTVGLVGLGAIGRHVAARLRPFGVSLQYFDVHRADAEEERSRGVTYVELNALLATSDVISLHVPLTPTTVGLITRERLAATKRGAVLINTCRGEVVDERALYTALHEAHLLGAGLDTFAVEPPAKDNPLFTLPNVILTPHIAGPTWESWSKRFVNGYANITRVTEGNRPLWVVPELSDVIPWWADS